MTRIIFLDCRSGISGDMVLGALIDAGADQDAIRKDLSAFDASIDMHVERVTRASISATSVSFSGGGSGRRYRDLVSSLSKSDLRDEVKAGASRIIEVLARAEAKVHGVAIDDVHFHEISAVDTIADAICVASALDQFDGARLVAGTIAAGNGTVDTQHGTLPLPAPATAELLRGYFIAGEGDGELATPTGAAIVAALATAAAVMPTMRLETIGYGAGLRDRSTPNVVRAFVGYEIEDMRQADEIQMEATIDDLNPEIYAYVMERLFEAGARDVWMVPAIGKKGRPATVLGLIASNDVASMVRDVLFAETSTIGVRVTPISRWMLARSWIDVDVNGQTVRVKVARSEGRVVNVAPEYDDCIEVARSSGLPLKEVFASATSAAQRLLSVDQSEAT